MNIDDNLVQAIVGGAMPFLITLVVFGAPVLFFYLRWQFKLRDKELDLQRELALRGLGPAAAGGEAARAPDAEASEARRVRVEPGPALSRVEPGPARSRDDDLDLGLALRDGQAEKLLGAPAERAVDERVKF